METTRRHPRTLQEAFGPYTSRDIYERVEETLFDKVVVSVSFVACLFLVLMIAMVAV